MSRIVRTVSAFALVCGTPAIAALAVDAYPSRPIRLVVPYPPGGGTDPVARLLSQKLGDAWHQQVVVDNRGGAAGVVGAELVARSAPDGYTLLFATAGIMIITPILVPKLAYDPLKDFSPVGLVAANPQLLVVNGGLPVQSVKELIALAKGSPGKLNYGTSGSGGVNHLAMELFRSMAGIDIVFVPYKGAGPAITDLLAGQVQLMFNPIPPFLPHVKSGRLRALGVSSAQRSRAVPDVPTIAEAGVPGFEYVSWYAIFAPAHTPRAVVSRLNAELVRIAAEPDVAQRLIGQGSDPQSSTPEGLAEFLRKDFDRQRRVIASAGLKHE